MIESVKRTDRACCIAENNILIFKHTVLSTSIYNLLKYIFYGV